MKELYFAQKKLPGQLLKFSIVTNYLIISNYVLQKAVNASPLVGFEII
jgi:hypothetical protein